MKTNLSEEVLADPAGKEMASILRNCVHCGFCNATCPTYQLRGDELDGPRGRIYLIKSMLEGHDVGEQTQRHLDRCLTCRSCETTCPSGVEYGRLVELARPKLATRLPLSFGEKLKRQIIATIVPNRTIFASLVWLGRVLKYLLPARLRELVPQRDSNLKDFDSPSASATEREMILFAGCAQAVVAPSIDRATKAVYRSLGIKLTHEKNAGCCGALDYHLGRVDQALDRARKNIDAWWPLIESNREAIVVGSSGCAVMLKDYANLLKNDPDYAHKAETVSRLIADPVESIDPNQLRTMSENPANTAVSFHAPCTMQHGTHADKKIRDVLEASGYQMASIDDAHLCCGSAGTYSLLQPEISEQLLDRKLANLQASDPQTIATGNIGCLMHLQRRSQKPVRHWIELVNDTLQ